MPRTLSGLNAGEFDTIDIYHSLTVGGHPGQPGTVLTSDGSNINWGAITLDTNSVDSLQIKDGAVTHSKIAAGAVSVPHLCIFIAVPYGRHAILSAQAGGSAAEARGRA
jgi:hypothetical protein